MIVMMMLHLMLIIAEILTVEERLGQQLSPQMCSLPMSTACSMEYQEKQTSSN